jgi:hypothetical protein
MCTERRAAAIVVALAGISLAALFASRATGNEGADSRSATTLATVDDWIPSGDDESPNFPATASRAIAQEPVFVQPSDDIAGSASDAAGGELRPAFGDPGLISSPPSLPLLGWLRSRSNSAVCDECPTHSLNAFFGYDTWRGAADDSWQNNGLHAGLNYGTRLGRFSELTGIGFQVGGSVGVYDWEGTEYRIAHNNGGQTQGFLTYGFFRKPQGISGLNVGIVQDWMFNNNFGVLAQNPTLGQLRGQVGYATSAVNELGVWGAVRDKEDTQFVSGFGPRSYRAINQISAFWHHKWGQFGPDTWVSLGVPEHDRLSGSGSLGDYLANAWATAPLSDLVSLYTQVMYMHPSSGQGPQGSTENSWMFAVGLSLYFGGNARSRTVAGQCWQPLMPVANNGFFLVDTNKTY